jgi:hypothetical protein
LNGTLSGITNNACVSGTPNSDTATITFTPTTDLCHPANGSFSYTVTDVSSPTNQSDTKSVNIAVTCVNDAPVNTVPGAQTTNEDVARVFSSGNGNLISIADVDAGSSPVQVTLTGTNGTVSLAGTGGLTFTGGDGTADPAMTFTGSVTNINTALNGLSFTPTLDFNGAASLTIGTDDLGNSGAGGALQDSDVVSITVSAVNDAPIAAEISTSTTEEVAVTVTLSATDVETCELTFITGAVTNGSVGVVSNNPCVAGTPHSDSATVTFTPAFNVCTPPGASFSYTASDGPASDTETVTITIACTPDPPQAVGLSNETNEDDSVDLILTGIDPDPGDCELGFTTGPVTNGTVGPVTPLPCTPGTTNVDFAQVTFSPSPDVCTPIEATFDHTVSDGSASSIADVDITIHCVNDLPEPLPDVKSTFEDEALSFPATDLSANDSKGPTNESSQTLTVSSVTATGDSHGSVGLLSGNVTYTPDPGYMGPASFNYEVCDDGMSGNPPAADPLCATGTVNVTVGLIVTSVGNGSHAGGGQICNDGTGACTLRAAIQQANAHAGADKIHFAISPGGAQTIAPSSALPTLTDPVTIDGTTQPGFGSCSGSRVIELDGMGAGAGADGLYITGGNSVVRGLAINNFGGSGIRLETGGANTVRCNYIGTDATGSGDQGNGGSGVYSLESPDNLIGGPVLSDRNTIAYNGQDGVRVDGANAQFNLISQNSIHSNALVGIENMNGGNGEPWPVPVILEAGSDAVPGAMGTSISCQSNCIVEIFTDDAEEGRTFHGTATTSGGNWSFPGPITTGNQITATVHDVDNRTSEFSPPYACPDSDNDGICNGYECDNDADLVCDPEEECGGDKDNASIIPERIDNPLAPDLDENNNGQDDEPLPPGVDIYDCDGDGYIGAVESGAPLCGNGLNDDVRVYAPFPNPQVDDDSVADDGCPGGPPMAGIFSEAQFNIGTTDQDPCGADGWPPDINQSDTPNSVNLLNILDLTDFLAPVRRLDTSPGHPDFDARFDLVPGRGFYPNWIAIDDLVSGLVVAPPMFAGARAWESGECPSAP